mgnify:CR=1 FL=1
MSYQSQLAELKSIIEKIEYYKYTTNSLIYWDKITYMPKNAVYLLEKNGFALDDLTYFIGHQANMRIMSNIAKQLNLPEEKFLHNIEELGNTGSVSSALVYAQNDHTFKKGDLVCLTVFGGGYSAGACLIQC